MRYSLIPALIPVIMHGIGLVGLLILGFDLSLLLYLSSVVLGFICTICVVAMFIIFSVGGAHKESLVTDSQDTKPE